MKKKIVTIVGARPQFIKVSPVSRVLRTDFNEILVNTGQHYDANMADIFFRQLNIPLPDYDLGVGSASHGKQTGIMLQELESILQLEKPDAVLVYGDTNSTLAGALAAAKLHIPIIHVEAGLRSYNKAMPEEVNRILTDHVSSLLFAPTESAVLNLAKENIIDGVYCVGDVMYDAMLLSKDIARNQYSIDTYGVSSKQYYLATIHRAENTDNKNTLENILQAFASMSADVLLPLHPRTKARIEEFGLQSLLKAANIKIIDPVSYLEMVMIEEQAKGIITDSGGVQKEAYFLQVPCYTLRTETEWVETVSSGWNHLLNPNSKEMSTEITKEFEKEYVAHLYGDGKASEKIVEYIHTLW